MTLLFLAMHFLFVISRYEILEYWDVEPFNLWETKRIELPKTKFPSCQLRFKTPDICSSVEHQNCRVARYYIKKREIRYSKGYEPLKYQFIASESPLVDPSDPLLQKDPGSFPNRPNEFYSQYGWVFCEKSRIEGLRMVVTNARQCGVEEMLLSLCLVDRDVNPGPGILTYINMGETFREDINNAREFRHRVEVKCTKFVGVRLPSNRKLGLATRAINTEMVDYYLKAAYTSGFDYAFSKYRCGTLKSDPWEWRYYPLTTRDNRETVKEIRRNIVFEKVNTVTDFMYFCMDRSLKRKSIHGSTHWNPDLY